MYHVYSLWMKLAILYEGKNIQNEVFMVERLVHLRYKDKSSMAKLMNDFQDIMNQLSNLEVLLTNEL